MCLFQLLRISYRPSKHSHDSFDNIKSSTFDTGFRSCSRSPRQQSFTSLSQLSDFDSTRSYGSRSSTMSWPRDSTLYGGSNDDFTSEDDAIYPEEAFECDDVPDSASLMSQANSTLTVCDSVSHGNEDRYDLSPSFGVHGSARADLAQRKAEAIEHSTCMGTAQRRRSTTKGCRVAESSPSVSKAKLEDAQLGSDKSTSTSVQALHNGQPGQSPGCCIGVLSAFEEKHLCKEDNEAISQMTLSQPDSPLSTLPLFLQPRGSCLPDKASASIRLLSIPRARVNLLLSKPSRNPIRESKSPDTPKRPLELT
jgi:hypothetical protein